MEQLPQLIKVIALDPGVTTGYVSGLIEHGKLKLASGQAAWNELQLYSQLNLGKPDIIVYERFEYRAARHGAYGNLSNVELFPRNLIGVINLYLQQNPEVICYTQMPAFAVGKNAYFSDNKLKTAGVYKVANPHANDAMRHILQWWQFGPGFQYNTNGFEGMA
jgi:hypothetical protein